MKRYYFQCLPLLWQHSHSQVAKTFPLLMTIPMQAAVVR